MPPSAPSRLRQPLQSLTSRSWPRPWQSSGPVGQCGATLLPGPSGRSSVHTSSKHGGVVLFAASRLPYERDQHQAWRRPLKPFSCRKHTQNSGISCGKRLVVVVVVVVVVVCCCGCC